MALLDSPARRADLAAAVLFVALALFGAWAHPMEEAGTAERDGFVAQAEQLLAGELPADPYRPLLYQLLIAAVAWLGAPLGLTPFVAARLLSNLAAALLARLAYFFGARLGGPAAGAGAFALVAVNPNLWRLGQHAATDMLFATLAAASLAAVLAHRERPTAGRAALAGALWGLAAFTRGSALLLVPGLALGLVLGSVPGLLPGRVPASSGRWRWRWRWRRRVASLAWAALGALVGLVPHWLTRWAAFGDPGRDDNWKNLAWKLYGDGDWSYLERVPFASAGEIVAADPGRFLAAGLVELERLLVEGLPQLLGTPVHGLAAVGGLALVVAGSRVPGISVGAGLEGRKPLESLGSPAVPNTSFGVPDDGARHLGRGGARHLGRLVDILVQALTVGVFAGALCFLFFAWGRFLLLALPVAAAWTAAGALVGGRRVGRWVDRWVGRRGGARPALPSALRRGNVWSGAVLLGLVALLALKTFAFRLPAFVDHHPWEERSAARALEAGADPGPDGELVIAGTAPFLGHQLASARWVALPDAFGDEVEEPGRWWEQVRALAANEGVDYLVASELELRDRPDDLLAERPPVVWLEASPVTVQAVSSAPSASQERPVRVWRVVPAELPAR